MLETLMRDLVLLPLTERQSVALYNLVQENHAHLTAHGDYADLVATSLEQLTMELRRPASENLRFGIFLRQQLIGRMDLTPVAPPRYGLGYWLAQNATGKGYATAALQALLGYARIKLEASDIFAGVTHGNSRSSAVLERVGFAPMERFETYTRFHKALD